MKTLLISLTAAVVLSSAIAAQYHPSGPQVTVDPDSLLEAGMDEILSYLLLTRDDFTFRDDYLEKDSFRLPIVDSLMHRPLGMNDFVDSCAIVFKMYDDTLDNLLMMVYLFNGTTFTKDSRTAWRNLLKATLLDSEKAGWKEYLKSIADKIKVGNDWSQYYLSELKASEIDLIVEHYKELILEDVTDKNKSAEEQDSISSAEEHFAIEFASFAKGLRRPFINMATTRIYEFNKIDSIFQNDPALKSEYLNKRMHEENIEGLRVIVGSFGDDIYRGEYDLIIDPGGNDSYHLSYDPANPHSVIIADFSGDDIYIAETDFALACGAFAQSLLIDYEGDDIYRGGNFSLGAGYFGVGILWDKKGDDKYFGDTFTQGAGTFGLGLLIDSEGSDTYTGNLFCQGFGFVSGVGGVIDHSGNDSYVVQPKYGDFIRYEDHYISLSQGFGYGVRPWLSGGWGFLFDYGGNDAYVCDIFGQGASYWWSLGMLYDKSGNDQYLSHQYTQGNGTHMSLGILRDDAGNDIYRAYGVSQGCGHDYSLGWLQDRRGDDLYVTQDLGHGAGQANGMGIFTDLIGNDRYYVVGKHNTQGYGNPRRDYGSIGIFLDLDGDDRYDGNGSNNRFWTLPGSKWGGGLDKQIPRPDSTEEANQ